eukprot:scpid83701/ scgid7905/ 
MPRLTFLLALVLQSRNLYTIFGILQNSCIPSFSFTLYTPIKCWFAFECLAFKEKNTEKKDIVCFLPNNNDEWDVFANCKLILPRLTCERMKLLAFFEREL